MGGPFMLVGAPRMQVSVRFTVSRGSEYHPDRGADAPSTRIDPPRESMADSRSVMQEFRFLEQKRQAGSLTSAETAPSRRAPRPGRLRGAGHRPRRLRRRRRRGPAPRVAPAGRAAQPAAGGPPASRARHLHPAAGCRPAPAPVPSPQVEPDAAPPPADDLLRSRLARPGGPAPGLESGGTRLRSRRAVRRGGLDRRRLRPERHLRLVGGRRRRASRAPRRSPGGSARAAEAEPHQFGEYDAAERRCHPVTAPRAGAGRRRPPPTTAAPGSTTPARPPGRPTARGTGLRRVRRRPAAGDARGRRVLLRRS